jgi:hypothetical protein
MEDKQSHLIIFLSSMLILHHRHISPSLRYFRVHPHEQFSLLNQSQTLCYVIVSGLLNTNTFPNYEYFYFLL